MYWTIGKYALIGVIGLSIGWVTNGWRLNASIASLKASYAEDRARYQEEARKATAGLIEASDRLRRNKDAQIKDLNSKLGAVVGQLQQREKRDTAVTDSAASCSGATGANLSREDAEFLARLAAEADKIVSELNYCIAQYNSVRDKLNTTK